MNQTTHARSKADSPTKLCGEPGCARPMRANGLCSTHYGQANIRQVEAICTACGTTVIKTNQWARARYRSVCSTQCRAFLQYGPQSCAVPETHTSRSSRVPSDHPSRVAIACSVPLTHPSRARRLAAFHAGYCRECAAGFVVASNYVGAASRYCSRGCARRTAKRARRAREHGASGSFTWDQFMRLTLSLGNVCAYCGGTNGDRPLDPDHVMPLSKGGHNGLTNILPSCRPCNSGKGDRLPSEWVRLCRLDGYDVDLMRFKHLSAHVFLPHAA